MSTIEKNDIVTIAFIGKLDNGAEFMTVTQENPMKVHVGASEMPPTVETALLGLKVGQTRKVRVSPDEGYGPRQKDLLQTIENPEFIEKIKPRPGMILSLKVEREGEEHQVPATVIEINDKSVVVDYNHPLAGHHLNYDITILDIQKSS
ncbi:FKBP-type peptidyl-prolyl cis-trans isomerase [Desulfopila aestuarii]|uniref:Peptidyl-prolyl cis-trans isomerase n=1 Tax=Desulfopila aestuarii DSM 18488 TaxID=1121416 RepID=A0A1M7YDK4_9BACT|nr:FKBP-type peptidyl-prolyl cis-trans isomerase [Desulfopila aestuarii]SHO50681.1 FKBP-type peptidyl-prolyl cis-trans isomerase SlpA [Desulfopila aestuarii DSM 18488]